MNNMMDQFVGACLRFRKVDVCVLTGSDIHFGELVVMGEVARQKNAVSDLDVPALCSKLHVSRSAISQMLASLEKKGCITRQVSPSDRRKISVRVTPRGRQYLAQSTQCYEQNMESLVQRFGLGNMETLIKLLNRLTDVCDEIKNERPEA